MQRRESGENMSQETKLQQDEDLLPEYDFSQGTRGKHYEAYKAASHEVLVELESGSSGDFPGEA